MSLENALEFSSAVLANPAMKAEVGSLIRGKSSQEAAVAVVAFGKAKGYDFTSEEVFAAQQKLVETNALSEEDLEKIAGGGNDGGYTEAQIQAGAGGISPTGTGNILGAGAAAAAQALIDKKAADEALAAAALAAAAELERTKQAARDSW